MQLQSLSKLQGASTQWGVSTRRTAQKQASILGTTPRTRPLRWSSRLRRTSGCCLCPARGALLWAWLLLATLVVPGAWSFLTEEQEELIVELHNFYRGMVSPSASAMLPLKWDSNLKVISEGYAAKCIWNHNPDLEETGENLYASTGSLDLRLALEKWFLEHLDFDYHNNTCPEDKMCGHYTQMVWADTHRVGCAFHICNTMEGLNFERANFLVCNYYPAGNYEEEKPYVEGDWCSRCPDNLQNCQNNLCVAEEEEEEMTVVPPLATSDSILPETSSTSSTTRTPRTTPRPFTQHPALGTDPPIVPDPPHGGEEEKEKEEEREKEEEKGKREDGVEDKKEGEMEEEVVIEDSAAGSSPPFLLVCLTGILILRL